MPGGARLFVEAGAEVPVFTDRTVSPSYVFDIGLGGKGRANAWPE